MTEVAQLFQAVRWADGLRGNGKCLLWLGLSLDQGELVSLIRGLSDQVWRWGPAGEVSVSGLALELEVLFALLHLPVASQSSTWLEPWEGGKEGGWGATGGVLACGEGQGARRACSSLLAAWLWTHEAKKIYLKNDFLDEKCHLSKKAVCDCSSLLRYDTDVISQTRFRVSRAAQPNFFLIPTPPLSLFFFFFRKKKGKT